MAFILGRRAAPLIGGSVGLINDLYYLEGTPPYSRLMLPAAPAPLLIVNLGHRF